MRELSHALRCAGITPTELARIYAICGFDFHASCRVAGPRQIISACMTCKSSIGYLNCPDSAATLFYLAFLKKR